MNKLTKKQADCFINNLSQYCFMAATKNDVEMSITRENILKLINRCTEKEFPAFNMRLLSHNHEESIYMIEQSCLGEKCRIVYGTSRQILHFSLEEFKQFTEGCQKICEWLEEQND